MVALRSLPLPTLTPLSLLSLLLLPLSLLSLPSASRGQTVRARGFHPFGPPDKAATGAVLETLQVRSQGECAVRALFHDSLGFNLERQPNDAGERSCEVTNTVTGCFTHNLETRAGWDYYFSGRAGQGEPLAARSGGFTISTYVSNPSEFPATLALDDPHRRWGVDCNREADTPDKECSRFVMTGIDDGDSNFDDLDYARCFMYGPEFSVSQQVASVVAVEFTSDPSAHQCPPNQVVTALSDNSGYYNSVDWMKCNQLLANWRVNYGDCSFTDPRVSGGGNTAWDASWNIGTPQDQVFGVVEIWRTGYTYTGFRACRLFRMA